MLVWVTFDSPYTHTHTPHFYMHCFIVNVFECFWADWCKMLFWTCQSIYTAAAFSFSLHSLISGKASHLSVTQSDCSCQLCTKRNPFGSRDTSIFLLSLKQTRFDCSSFNFKASSIRGGWRYQENTSWTPPDQATEKKCIVISRFTYGSTIPPLILTAWHGRSWQHTLYHEKIAIMYCSNTLWKLSLSLFMFPLLSP